MYNFNSYYLKFANQKLNWLPMDTEELYLKNLKNRYEDLKSNGWIDNHFTYDFNSLGFRCKEFTDASSIMYLGCSYTIGIGLPVEHIWPELVSKELNLKCVNLGIGGASLDTVFRLCLGYIDKIKPKIIILLIPPGIRYELVSSDRIDHFVVQSADEYYYRWAIDKNNNYFNQQKNILAIEMLCKYRNIKFICRDSEELYNISENSWARDLAHVGIKAHLNFSKELISII